MFSEELAIAGMRLNVDILPVIKPSAANSLFRNIKIVWFDEMKMTAGTETRPANTPRVIWNLGVH